MLCPDCNREISDPWTRASGTHHEVRCLCGADLQWDQPMSGGSHPDRTAMGPPEACGHPEARPGAKVPISN